MATDWLENVEESAIYLTKNSIATITFASDRAIRFVDLVPNGQLLDSSSALDAILSDLIELMNDTYVGSNDEYLPNNRYVPESDVGFKRVSHSSIRNNAYTHVMFKGATKFIRVIIITGPICCTYSPKGQVTGFFKG